MAEVTGSANYLPQEYDNPIQYDSSGRAIYDTSHIKYPDLSVDAYLRAHGKKVNGWNKFWIYDDDLRIWREQQLAPYNKALNDYDINFNNLYNSPTSVLSRQTAAGYSPYSQSGLSSATQGSTPFADYKHMPHYQQSLDYADTGLKALQTVADVVQTGNLLRQQNANIRKTNAEANLITQTTPFQVNAAFSNAVSRHFDASGKVYSFWGGQYDNIDEPLNNLFRVDDKTIGNMAVPYKNSIYARNEEAKARFNENNAEAKALFASEAYRNAALSHLTLTNSIMSWDDKLKGKLIGNDGYLDGVLKNALKGQELTDKEIEHKLNGLEELIGKEKYLFIKSQVEDYLHDLNEIGKTVSSFTSLGSGQSGNLTNPFYPQD